MAHRFFLFGEYCLDAAAHELWRGRERVALPRKSFECLAYLIEHRERSVGRDELIAAVWERADVADTVLAPTLLRARRAIGDTGTDQAMVRTVPRFGYRWVAETQAVDERPDLADAIAAAPAASEAPPAAADPSADSDPAATPSQPRRAWSRRSSVTAALALLVAIAVVAAGMLWRSHPAAPETARPADAAAPPRQDLYVVLPVNLQDADAETAWIRLGAMDYLASRLRQDARLRVLPSDQVIALLGKDEQADPSMTGELRRLETATHASHILVTHARRSGDQWTFVLDVYHGGSTRTVQASADAPLLAARLASARFMEGLGVPPAAMAESDNPQRAELLQRIDAAMLAGDLEAARTLIRAAPAALAEDAQIALRSGQIAFRAGQHDVATRWFEPLADEHATAGAVVRAEALIGLGDIAMRRQDYVESERTYSRAVAALGEQGDPRLIGKALSARGLVNGYLGQLDQAMADFARSRAELERAGAMSDLASLSLRMGMIDRTRGRFKEAADAFDSAVSAFERMGIRDSLATALIGKSDAQTVLLDVPGALATTARGWELAPHLENKVLVRYLAMVRGNALLAAGQLSATAALLEQLGADSDPDNVNAIPDLVLIRVRLFEERGQSGAILHSLDAMLDRFEHPADPTYRTNLSSALLVLVGVALADGQSAVADRLLERLKALQSPAPDNYRQIGLELATAQVMAARNDAEAAQHFATALAFADRRSQPDLTIAVCSTWARYLLRSGSRDDRITVIGRLAPYVDRDYRAAHAVAALYATLGDHALAEAATAKAKALAGERDLNLLP